MFLSKLNLVYCFKKFNGFIKLDLRVITHFCVCKNSHKYLYSICNSIDVCKYPRFTQLFSRYYKTKTQSHQNEVARLSYLVDELYGPYEVLLTSLINNWTIPQMPKHFCFREGWTKYDSKTNYCYKVPFPEENVLIFDIEVIVKEGKWPSIAVCLGKESWYSWVSNRLMTLDDMNRNIVYTDELIPLFDNKDRNNFRCVIGHFVSFDRSRVANEYAIQGSNTRYVDTMSMHIAISGMTNSQRNRYKTPMKMNWQKVTSRNSLLDVYSHYFPKIDPPQNKDNRNIFVKGSCIDIINNFQMLMKYCATDVLMTTEIFQKLFPIFQSRFPHKSIFYGMLELNSLYLPTNEKWLQFIDQSTNEFENYGLKYQKNCLMKAANLALMIGKDNKYKNDPWLWDLKWTYAKNFPRWYRDLIPKDKPKNEDNYEPSLISTQMSITIKLLRLLWDGVPLYYDKEFKWGILKPCNRLKNETDIIITVPENFPKKEYFKDYNQSNDLSVDLETNNFSFYSLVHKDGYKSYVSRPLSEDLISTMSNNRLTSDFNIGNEFLQSLYNCIFWKSNELLIKNQMIVKVNRMSDNNEMAIIPLVVPISDANRKINEKLWFNNFYLSNKIGAEFKSMIMAPHNYVFVGHTLFNVADWLVGIFGDSIHGELGGSLFGKEVLKACSNNLFGFNSALYSNLSKITGFDENICRRLIFIIIYGGRTEDVANFLWKNVYYNITDAKNNAAEYVEKVKGRRHQKIWQNGILSDFFNAVYKIIKSNDLETPFLKSKFSKPLKQSTISDLLKCLLKSSIADYISNLIIHTKALIIEMKLDSRLSVCNNHEIRFLCHENDKYKMAYVLHSADSATRTAFTSLLSLGNLPSELRFLEGVDIDKCWRMNPIDDFCSESYRGIYHSYGIKPGCFLNFDELLLESKI